jgi:hypothetical protein
VGRATPYCYTALLAVLLGIRAVNAILVRRRRKSPLHLKGDTDMQTSVREWARGLVVLAGSVFLVAGCASSMTADQKEMGKGEMTQEPGMAKDKGMSLDKEKMQDKSMMEDTGKMQDKGMMQDQGMEKK